jgi:methyl-accepting chemotaxis protein/hemerythrin
MAIKSAWEKEQALGVKSMDTEHRLQTRLVASLRDAVETGRERAVVAELLRRLEDTSKVHFLSEELLMRLDAYEHYGAHVEEHRRLLDQLATLCQRFEAEPGLDLRESLDWIEGWLGDHIKGMDRRFTESLEDGDDAEG